MTKEQREKIAEIKGVLYIASTVCVTDSFKEMLKAYADDLAELLADDNKSVDLGNGFGLTINAEDIARGRLSETEVPPIEPIKHGRWLIYNILDYAKRPTGRKVGKCSICGQLTPDFRLITEEPNWNYCPNCGARMDEVKE